MFRPLRYLHFRLVSSLIFGSLLKGLSKIVFRSNCCEVDLNYSCGQNYNRFALLLEIPQKIRFEEDSRRGLKKWCHTHRMGIVSTFSNLAIDAFYLEKTATI